MNNPELMVVLLLGTCLMCGVISVQMKWYGIAWWKSIFIAAALVLTGLYGSRLWYYIENGSFTGRSFYGAVFLSPLVFWLVSKMLRIPYGYTLDFVAPGGCLTLALVKIQCLNDGCCAGMPLYVDENHIYVKFPSQIVEMVSFLIIAAVLLWLSSKKEKRGILFAWFMALYGATRFVLDFFRGGTEPFALGLTAGSFWSLVALLIGCVVLLLKGERLNGERAD